MLVTRRRIIGAGGSLTIVVVAIALVLALGGGGAKSRAVPATARAGTGLMDALAPVLSEGRGGASTAAPAATAAASATTASSATASGGLPASRARSAARLFLVGIGGTRASPGILRSFARHEWGGVVLEPGNGSSPQQVADLVGAIRGSALSARHVAPLIAASQLGGALDAVPVGSAPQAAAAGTAGAQAAARGAARALRPLGVRMVLAPDADIGFAGGPWEGVSFSDDPATASAMVAAAVAGWKAGKVAPAPGHFPGEGAASGDPALEAATVGLSLDELKARDLKPFAAIAQQAPAIQLSAATYVAFDGVTPATLLPEVVGLLRGDLGFGGVIVSGDLAAASLAGGEPVAQLAVRAIKAGVDLVWIPGDAGDQDAAWRAIVRALRTGEIPVARVADALARVSRLRADYGAG
jgi:beta-N-acetylhexosaminidase